MMKKIRWFWWLFPLLAFTQCKFTANKAIQYNNKIIQSQNKINGAISRFFKVLEKSTESKKDSTKVFPAYDDLVQQVNNQLDSTRTLESIDADSSFKVAAVELFEFYQKIVQEDYARLIPLVLQKAVTQEEQDLIKTMQEQIKKGEDAPYQKFRNAQLKFAKKHGFDQQLVEK